MQDVQENSVLAEDSQAVFDPASTDVHGTLLESG